MKMTHLARITFATIVGIVLAPFALSAQAQSAQSQDSVVAVAAEAKGLLRVPHEDLPFYGTFWEVRNTVPCFLAPLPCPPLDASLPIYAIADGQFLVDETAGQLTINQRKLSTIDYASLVQEQFDELTNFIAQVQARQQSGLRTCFRKACFRVQAKRRSINPIIVM